MHTVHATHYFKFLTNYQLFTPLIHPAEIEVPFRAVVRALTSKGFGERAAIVVFSKEVSKRCI